MPVTLKDADWKAVLNKPKNAGLKIGKGTGVGEKLVSLDSALKEYNKDLANEENHKKLIKCYEAVKTQCESVIKKHEKLFTEACTYLKQVKEMAIREKEVRSNQAAEVAARREVRSHLQRFWGDLINETGNAQIRQTCAKVLKVFQDHKGSWDACAAAENKMRVAMSKLDGIEAGTALRKHEVGDVFTEVIQKATKG